MRRNSSISVHSAGKLNNEARRHEASSERFLLGNEAQPAGAFPGGLGIGAFAADREDRIFSFFRNLSLFLKYLAWLRNNIV